MSGAERRERKSERAREREREREMNDTSCHMFCGRSVHVTTERNACFHHARA
jgi:hypothetical protein